MGIPLMAVKSDGGFGYDSTDLAAIYHRLFVMRADWIVYVTDLGQETHFHMIFDAAEQAGWHRPSVTRCDHMGFGVVQGADGKKFKTRSGETVKLKDLLDEAVTQATADMESRNEGKPLTPDQLDAARVLGIGAVKYADLSMSRESNYRFSFKKMLNLQGNTAPYMLYAYVRIQGIRRKAKEFMEQEGLSQGDLHMSVDEFSLDTP